MNEASLSGRYTWGLTADPALVEEPQWVLDTPIGYKLPHMVNTEDQMKLIEDINQADNDLGS